MIKCNLKKIMHNMQNMWQSFIIIIATNFKSYFKLTQSLKTSAF